MSKLIDLTGQRFYEWTVIRKGQSTKDAKTRWECRCSCGKIGLVTGYDLKKGKHKSCGHDRDRGIVDLKGKVFGELTALEYAGDRSWNCVCSCGKLVRVKSYDLTTGHTKSCGHNTNGFKDLSGQTFGEWTVLEYAENHMWKCICSCGVVSNVHSYSLRSGGSKSCGRHNVSKKLEGLEGQTFNDWKVLKYVGDSTWECECSCGNKGKVAAYDLKQGNSKNCGHDRKTPYKDLSGMKFGELTVLKYLYKNLYLCECSCGTQKEIQGSNMTSGGTISCGCKQLTEYTEEVIRSLIEKYTKENGEAPYSNDIAKILGITYYYVNVLVNRYNLRHLMNNSFGSRYERDIFNLIKEIDPNILVRNRDRTALGNGKELDFYIPSKRLAIEFNGDYWHSEERIGSKYHQEKTIECAKKGIQLIHIFQHEWENLNTRSKIIEMIKGKVDGLKSKRISGRKCEIREVDIKSEREFVDKYHLQNYVASSIAYGLYYKNEIVSIMSFGKPRFNSAAEWELVRYCVKNGVAVIGGAEKLFQYFIKNKRATSVISYCDISKFHGKVYAKLGFQANKADITAPNYKWIKYNTADIDILTRYQTQKQRLLDLGLGEYGNTEDEIMRNLGYLKVYDSGNLRFTWVG